MLNDKNVSELHLTTLSINSLNCNFEPSISFEDESFLWYNFSTVLKNFKMHSSFLLIKFVGAMQGMQRTI